MNGQPSNPPSGTVVDDVGDDDGDGDDVGDDVFDDDNKTNRKRKQNRFKGCRYPLQQTGSRGSGSRGSNRGRESRGRRTMRDSPALTGTPKRALSHRRPANHAQHSQGRCEPPPL